MTCTILVVICTTIGLAAGSVLTLVIGHVVNIVENRQRRTPPKHEL